jgi:hypothetical protein
MAALAKLLILEESVLVAMAGNPIFLKEFPFLSGLKLSEKTKSSCGRCNRSSSRRLNSINGIKSSLIAMGVEKKQRLKKMLNAEKVRIRVANGGRVTEYTF